MTAKTGGYEYRVCPFKDAHQEEGKSKVRCAMSRTRDSFPARLYVNFAQRSGRTTL